MHQSLGQRAFDLGFPQSGRNVRRQPAAAESTVTSSKRRERSAKSWYRARPAPCDLESDAVQKQVCRPRWPRAMGCERGITHLERVIALPGAEVDDRHQRVQIRFTREVDVQRLELSRSLKELRAGVIRPRAEGHASPEP